MASVKLMAPLFTSFDHPTYQKLVSQHIADVICMPPSILTMFEQGAFVVSISGTPWHSVGIDEAHEMLINKEVKTSVVRPLVDFMNRVAHYIPYQTKALEILKENIFPEQKHKPKPIASLFSSHNNDLKFMANVRAMVTTINKHEAFAMSHHHRGLVNPYTSQEATNEQSHDLLRFRSMGEEEHYSRIQYFILNSPSVAAPQRKKRLQTFTVRVAQTKQLTQAEKDKKLILTAMLKKMQHSKRTGKPIERPGEQLLELPMAISDHNGDQLKGQKCYSTKCFETRYKGANPPVFLNQLPSNWVSQCCLMEGMFMINTTPLGSHKTLGDYSKFLMKRYLVTEFHKGLAEVHVIFDNPGLGTDTTPKHFEQKRRDKSAPVSENHQCCKAVSTTAVTTTGWRKNFLNCRTCKRNLVIFLGDFFLSNIGSFLGPHQTLFVGGAFQGNIANTAWYVRGQKERQPNPAFSCNAMETDTRLWLHAKQTTCKRIVVISPDTDVYHVGLPLSCVREKEVVVQLNEASNRQLKYLNVANLIQALQNDPDLANLDTETVPHILQTLYVSTGCDYTSFFSKLGKATFFKFFLQYATFITAGKDQAPGTLANTNFTEDTGFLAFMRLVGTVYFKKHASGFTTASPATHFLKFGGKPNQTPQEHHSEWLEDIRQNIWLRTIYENEFLPSDDALYLHWQRTRWVCQMWKQADHNIMLLQPITKHGWGLHLNSLTVIWDSINNMAAIRERVSHLLRGCKCVTGCTTRRCSCRKKDSRCSEGCQCQNCNNLGTQAQGTESRETDELQLVAVSELHELEEVDDLMDMIFGDEDETEMQGPEIELDCECEDSSQQ